MTMFLGDFEKPEDVVDMDEYTKNQQQNDSQNTVDEDATEEPENEDSEISEDAEKEPDSSISE